MEAKRKETSNNVAAFLEKRYLQWQNKVGRKTIAEFAQYLCVNRSLLSQWMNSSALPGNENVIKIANKLGPDIYEILGWPLPVCYAEQPKKAKSTLISIDNLRAGKEPALNR